MQLRRMLVHRKIREHQAECLEQLRNCQIGVDEYTLKMISLETELKDVEQKMYAVSYGADQIDLSRFLSESVPIAFEKIHVRFPHLTLDRIIEFEKALRIAGGSVMVHSGKFVLSERELGPGIHNMYPMRDHSITWTCCHSIYAEGINLNQDWSDTVYYEVKFMPDSVAHKNTYFCNIDKSTKHVRRRIGITDDYDGH